MAATATKTDPITVPVKVDTRQVLADVEKVEQAVVRALGANVAAVPIGPSEITSGAVIVAGLCTSFFGHDWGLNANAQALGVVVSGVVTVGITIARAIKHHAVLATARKIITSEP